jgi:hypothetical protein
MGTLGLQRSPSFKAGIAQKPPSISGIEIDLRPAALQFGGVER